MIFDDIKYLRMLPLENYKEVNNPPYFANFRCPVCGDSEKSQKKRRGWAFKDDKYITIHCYNCGYSNIFGKFLKQYYNEYYSDYIKEVLGNNMAENKTIRKPRKKIVNDAAKPVYSNKVDLGLPSINSLPNDHYAKRYVIDDRLIPAKYWDKIFFTEDFPALCKKFDKDLYDSSPERIIIPFYDSEGNIFAFQGRHMEKGSDSPKYITIKIDDSADKIYGLDTVDFNKTVYVVEGPIDSMFIDNCIATVGSVSSFSALEKYTNNSNYVLIFDNEKRNYETMKFMEKALKLGFKIVIWPNRFIYKDINSAIQAGYRTTQIKSIIDENIFEGTKGQVRLKIWRAQKW